ncbi:MAG TPA: EAL domain-containing protein [Burkholderiaceae bacterium]|nr:EAL domain-containing protein [Burkholderiaceae bacterium]
MINRLKQHWSGKGLLARLLLPVVLLIVLALIGRSIFLIQDEKSEGISRNNEQVQEVRKLMAPAIAKIASRGDVSTIEWLLSQHVKTRSSIDQVTWRFQKTVLTATNSDAVQLNAPDWFARFLDLDAFETTTPVTLEGVVYGDLTLRTNPAPLVNKLWRRMLAQAPTAVLLLVLLVVSIQYILRANLTTLQRLSTAANKFKLGEHHVRVPEIGAPETRAAAHAFNNMADELQKLLQSLNESEATFRRLFEDAHDPVMLIKKGRIIACNLAALMQLGFSSRQQLLNHTFQDISPRFQPDGRFSSEKAAEIMATTEQVGHQRFDWIHLKKDGTVVPVEVTLTSIQMKGSVVLHALLRDMTQRFEQARVIAAVQNQLQATLDAIPDLLFEVGLDGLIHGLHSGREDLLTAPSSSIVGKRAAQVLPAEAASEVMLALKEAHELGQSQGHQYALELPQGRVWFELSVARKPVEEGHDPRFILLARDITDRRQRMDEVSWQAGHDALTGLPNRALLADRFTRAMASTQRQGCLLAVCMLDLDGFKPVNDTFGHEAGDMLLVELSERLARAVRGEDTVARLGGDEFVLLLGDLKDIGETELMLRRIQDAMAAPYAIEGEKILISASIGVAVYPLDESDPDTLLRHADLAMYQAKDEGRNRHHIFDVALDREGLNHRQQIERIKQAFENGEFRVYYQPKVNMRTGRVVGMEALLRWQHPENGVVRPLEFLPLVEHASLIVDIGEWVASEALAQIERWSAQGRIWPVGVNIAARHFQHPDFLPRLKAILDRHPDVPPNMLELEIVESAALGDIQHVGRLVLACQQELGVRFALDDFGTGYSSLTYLKRLSTNTLKVDQSFVRDMLDDQEDLALVEAVISLASVFNRSIVAEGVETSEHGIMLMRLGCDIAQGDSIAPAMLPDPVWAWAEQFVPDPHWAIWANVPWQLDDFPLLLAHRDLAKWKQRVTMAVTDPSSLNGAQQLPDQHHGRFSIWYANRGRTRYGYLPAFSAIEPVQDTMYRLSHDITSTGLSGGYEAASAEKLQRLEDLHGQLAKLVTDLQSAVIEELRWPIIT